MLRTIRIIAAVVCFSLLTLLFLDFSGTLHAWFGWLARVQFIPALLALNFGVVFVLLLLTLLFGRIYCSVICPLGVMMDGISWLAGQRRKNRFAYSPAKTWLRWGVLVGFFISLVAGAGLAVGGFATLIEPYSAFGRIAMTLWAPLWAWGNNALAYVAQRADSYAFYSVDVWMRSGVAIAVSVGTLVVLVVLAWRNGRTWCNTICPVGTLLGRVASRSLFKPQIDKTTCNGCKLCARNCKSSCIDPATHTIDYSRCVACMDCVGKCRQGAISYTMRRKPKSEEECSKPEVDASRRKFLAVAGLFAYTAVQAQRKKVDGGLALIVDKQAPRRDTPLLPPGAKGVRNMAAHCTGCQLCVAACPNQVLRPSEQLATFMQPYMSFERGYCRPECTKCSQVCPAGAIQPLTTAEKSSTQIGHAVWLRDNCLAACEGVKCDNCARHCPVAAIHMVRMTPGDESSPLIPAVNEARCIGCGACENLCPARPFSGIYVEGHREHRTV